MSPIICQFLQEMDHRELEIQSTVDNSPESISELVIEKLKENRDSVNPTTIGIGLIAQAVFYGLSFLCLEGGIFSRARLIGTTICSLGLSSLMKYHFECKCATIEGHKRGADERLRRLLAMCNF